MPSSRQLCTIYAQKMVDCPSCGYLYYKEEIDQSGECYLCRENRKRRERRQTYYCIYKNSKKSLPYYKYKHYEIKLTPCLKCKQLYFPIELKDGTCKLCANKHIYIKPKEESKKIPRKPRPTNVKVFNKPVKKVSRETNVVREEVELYCEECKETKPRNKFTKSLKICTKCRMDAQRRERKMGYIDDIFTRKWV